MEPTTEGRYRVLESTRREAEWLLLDVETGDPTYVPGGGYDAALAGDVADLEPGNRVRATLSWPDGDPHLVDLTVEARTRFRFGRTREPLFEPARACWREARAAEAPMNSQVTYGTDGEANGVVYTFADQPGQRDLFEEFRDGVKPLEPLVARLAERADPPFEAFVLDPVEEPFVLVCITLERDGIFARTLRDTYLDAGLAAALGDGGLDDVAGSDGD